MLPRVNLLHDIEARLQELPHGIKGIIVGQSIFQCQEKFFLTGFEDCHSRTNQMIVTSQITDKRVRQAVKSGTGIIRITRPEAALEITFVESMIGNGFVHTKRSRFATVHDTREIHRTEIVRRTVHFPPETGQKAP